MLPNIYQEKFKASLSNEEINNLFISYHSGSEEAFGLLIEHNLRLVLFTINKYFSGMFYDIDELFSIGKLGLIKAIKTYDYKSKIVFNTYAITCIQNELRSFFRKLSHIKERPFLDDDNNYNLYSSSVNIEEEYLEEERKIYIEKAIDSLNEVDKEIIILRFLNNVGQIELARKYGMGQSWISRRTEAILYKIRENLRYYGYFDGKVLRKKNKK